jgi:hypothetical protein
MSRSTTTKPLQSGGSGNKSLFASDGNGIPGGFTPYRGNLPHKKDKFRKKTFQSASVFHH